MIINAGIHVSICEYEELLPLASWRTHDVKTISRFFFDKDCPEKKGAQKPRPAYFPNSLASLP